MGLYERLCEPAASGAAQGFPSFRQFRSYAASLAAALQGGRWQQPERRPPSPAQQGPPGLCRFSSSPEPSLQQQRMQQQQPAETGAGVTAAAAVAAAAGSKEAQRAARGFKGGAYDLSEFPPHLVR